MGTLFACSFLFGLFAIAVSAGPINYTASLSGAIESPANALATAETVVAAGLAAGEAYLNIYSTAFSGARFEGFLTAGDSEVQIGGIADWFGLLFHHAVAILSPLLGCACAHEGEAQRVLDLDFSPALEVLD